MGVTAAAMDRRERRDVDTDGRRTRRRLAAGADARDQGAIARDVVERRDAERCRTGGDEGDYDDQDDDGYRERCR